MIITFLLIATCIAASVAGFAQSKWDTPLRGASKNAQEEHEHFYKGIKGIAVMGSIACVLFLISFSSWMILAWLPLSVIAFYATYLSGVKWHGMPS